MLDFSLFFFVQNIFVITLLFWGLSFLGDKYFKESPSKYSEEVFECGFFTTSSVNITFNFNFFIICALLVLYDVEFILLTPFLFNAANVHIGGILIFLIFYSLVVFSFLIDWELVSITWAV